MYLTTEQFAEMLKLKSVVTVQRMCRSREVSEMVGGRVVTRVQVQRVKREKRNRENASIAAMIVCLFAVIYIGGHLIWWAIR